MAGYIGSKASVVSSGAERKKTFAITTSTTTLTGLSYTVDQVHVFHNGVRLVDGTDYTATNGTSITLMSAAENGDEVVVISYAGFQVADAYTQAEADAEFVQDPNGAITVDGSNVGIGTSSPQATAEISGGLDNRLRINSTDGTTSNDYGIDFSTAGVVRGGIRYNAGNNHLALYGYDNAERMRIDSSGRVTTPYQPAFIASGPGQYETFGSDVDIQFTSVLNNTGGYYNGSTGRFTAPVTGYYLFSVHLFHGSGNADRLTLARNGAHVANPYIGNLSSAATINPISAQQIVYCTAGDYITVRSVNYSHQYFMGHCGFAGRFLG
jgi:hypothetical protein